MKYTDDYRHKGLRRKLINDIRERGIRDERVLQAMDRLPRHFFLDSSFIEFAYKDQAFPIGSGQTISQPYTVAFQSELLEVHEGMKVLEIGTGSGYQSCILVELGAKVFSVERQRKLYEKTKVFLPSIGYNPRLFYGDGYKGLPAFAPFNRILITAAAPSIPEALFDQLAIGGILVVPEGSGEVQTMKKIIKTEEGKTQESLHGSFRFVPMLEKKAND